MGVGRWMCRTLLRLCGWSVDLGVPDYPKALICVAPHTSNVDFLLCELAYWSVGRRAGFLMKSSWFRWPLGALFRALGGVAVDRSGGQSLTQMLIDRFKAAQKLTVAITPEGTRSRTTRWHSGFLRVAYEAQVPLLLAVIDGGTHTIRLTRRFEPTGCVEADMQAIKQYYSQFTALYPHKFSTEPHHDE